MVTYEAFEKQNTPERLLYNGEQVWPRIRGQLGFVVRKNISGTVSSVPPSSKADLLLPLKVFSSILMLMRRHSLVVFSNKPCLRSVDGQKFDIFTDPISLCWGDASSVRIEDCGANGLDPEGYILPRVVDARPIELVIRLVSKFIKIDKRRFEGTDVIDAIERQFAVGPQKIFTFLKYHIAARIMYSVFLSIIRPKMLVVVCSYGNLAPLVEAAKKKKVPVVEVQHGVVSQGHFAYNVSRDMSKECFPDYFLSFGEFERKFFKNGFFVEPDHVVPVGHYYIEKMKRAAVRSELLADSDTYSTTVAVTLQDVIEKRVMDFILSVALQVPSYRFIIIPRRKVSADFRGYQIPGNVHFFDKCNFYEIIRVSQVHVTAYSTCAIEAPAFSVPNILLNFDNISREYYGEMLNDARITRYVSDESEFVNILNNVDSIFGGKESFDNYAMIQPGYDKNIHRFVDGLRNLPG